MATNAERSQRTRTRLLDAARELFGRDGYVGTSTAAILDKSGIQRGAMYHHFEDKAELFAAVCGMISQDAAAAITAATANESDPIEALIKGGRAWIAFMNQPGVRQIMIIDSPNVLGATAWDALERAHGDRLLGEGVNRAMASKRMRFGRTPALLTTMLSGALNSLALRQVPQSEAQEAFSAMILGLCADGL
ncbi:MAG: TetR/AcrR family transcriptional regulator [Phycisphaerales bacterium]